MFFLGEETQSLKTVQDAIPWSIWAQAAVGIEQELLQISNLQHLQEKEAFANRKPVIGSLHSVILCLIQVCQTPYPGDISGEDH